ncbi:GtrA family protein [Novosphingobium sp. BL-8H]|uniref:GtrA family protein n=1 Tax=Novosphingobium sp. BL-8H TaxID=3127640 RepID=UPI003757ED38
MPDTGRIAEACALLRNQRFLRYLIASVGALAMDMGSLLALLRLDVPAGLAAAMAYSLGIVVQWLLLSRAVFNDGGVAQRGIGRTRQKVVFVSSALLGLAVTSGIVSAAAALGVSVLANKVLAVTISFTLNWLLRKRIVFRVPAEG